MDFFPVRIGHYIKWKRRFEKTKSRNENIINPSNICMKYVSSWKNGDYGEETIFHINEI